MLQDHAAHLPWKHPVNILRQAAEVVFVVVAAAAAAAAAAATPEGRAGHEFIDVLQSCQVAAGCNSVRNVQKMCLP